MEEKIKILEEQVESCKKYFEAYKDDESFKRRETYKQTVAYCDALESLINGYRELEEWKREEGCSLQEVHDLFIPKSKVDEKIEKYKKLGNEFYEKFLETNKTDIDIHDAGISCDAKVQVLQELKEG